MSTTIETPTTARTPDGPEQPESVDLSIGEVAHRVYALFYNKRIGLFIIIAMGVLTLLGVLFPQAPDGIRYDAEVWPRFLESLRPRYGGWTDVLGFVGMFDMFNSWKWRVVTILLVLSIIACTTHRFPLLWKQSMRPHTHVKDAFFRVAHLRGTAAVAASPADALAQTAAALRKAGYRVVPAEGAEDSALYADRNRFAPFGTVIAHTAFVVILAGVFLTSLLGFRNDSFVAPVGQRLAVAGTPGFELEALSFADRYDAEGRPTDYVSDVVLYDNGREARRQEIRVNTPLVYRGWSFQQASFGAAAQLTVTRTATGEQLRDETVALGSQTDDGRNVFGKLLLEAENLEVYVVAPASGVTDQRIGAGQLLVEIYRPDSNEPMGSKVLTQGQGAELGEYTFTFVRERQYTLLMVVKDPGSTVVWIGSALLMIGTCATMFLRHHRIWARVVPTAAGSEVLLASPDRHDSIFARRFHQLVATISGTTEPEGSDHDRA